MMQNCFLSKIIFAKDFLPQTKNRINAFTLAEVLITLAIIGVVAAMTIPSLINSTKDLELKTAWKKEFSILNQAGISMAADNGGDLVNLFGTVAGQEDTMIDYYSQYLKVTKKCMTGKLATDGCWHKFQKFYKYSGDPYENDWDTLGGLVLNDGTFVALVLNSPTCTHTDTAKDNGCGYITVDVNGFKGPNKVGKDIFGMFLLKNGTVAPYGTQDDAWQISPIGVCDLSVAGTLGWACSYKFLYE